jgi:uncharacterized membrane protein HdeD (DUF308 family)
VTDPNPTEATPADRRERFEADLAEIQVKTGAAANEPRMVALGWVLMIAGIAVAIGAFFASGSQADSRDVISSVILGLAGVGLTVMGAAVFLRYSLGRFFRAWLLRLVYEQQQGR